MVTMYITGRLLQRIGQLIMNYILISVLEAKFVGSIMWMYVYEVDVLLCDLADRG